MAEAEEKAKGKRVMKKNKVILLYNSHAGDGTFKNHLDKVIERFQEKDMMVIPYKIENPEKIVAMLEDFDRESVKKIIVSGGDGTIDICINALMKAGYDQVPLAIFPNGTANDFAHYFSIPTRLDDMISLALGDHYTYSDVGMINQKYFINVASLGFLIDVSQKTDPNLKNSLGMLSYYIRGLGELPNMKPIRVQIICKEFTFSEDILFMLIMNGSSAGGFKRIAPKACVNDGKFDVIVFKACPVIEIMGLLLSVLRGEHIESPYVHFFQTDQIRIECQSSVGTDIDGEKGPDFPLDITILPRRLRINTLANDMPGNLWT